MAISKENVKPFITICFNEVGYLSRVKAVWFWRFYQNPVTCVNGFENIKGKHTICCLYTFQRSIGITQRHEVSPLHVPPETSLAAIVPSHWGIQLTGFLLSLNGNNTPTELPN
jgi:hypothetical protein